MARRFEITELRKSIRVSVSGNYPIWARIIVSFIPAVAAISIGHTLLGNWIWLVAFCVAAIMFAAARGSHADLDVTNVEFVTRGNIGRRGSRTTQIVCTGDVRGLEFLDSTGQRSGLYALTARNSKCILPFVDYSEAMEVLRAIRKKFPGLAEVWRVEPDASERLLTLGLGKEE